MNPITVCCAAVLMLGLAACGSDNGDGGMTLTPPPPTTPPAPVPVAVDLSGVRADATAGMAEIAAGASETIGDITFTCTAGGEACSVTVDADGVATATGGMVTAANSAAYTERTKDAAVTKEMAMATEAAQTAANDGGLGGSNADGTPVTSYDLDISRPGADTTITITDSAMAGEADPKFAQIEDMMDGRTMHERYNGMKNGMDEHEVVLVSSDIAAPRPTPFAMVPGQALNVDLEPTVDGPDGDGDVDNDFTALTVANTAAVRALVSSNDFASGSGSAAVLTFPADDADTADTDEAYETAGTYNGAQGTYRCDADAPCTISVQDDGSITNIGTGWVFTPEAGATSDVPDSDYLHYGFWLKRTTGSDGAVTYNEVETFAGSSVAASGDIQAVKGRATYDGGAVGVYMMKHRYRETTAELVDATSGHFRAQANLTATFGQTDDLDIRPRLLNSLTGTIDQFELSGGETNDWSVELDGDIDAANGTASGNALVSNMDAGSFSATFHGSVAPVGGEVPQPGSVVGEFNANFENGAVAGAFGATKPEEE